MKKMIVCGKENLNGNLIPAPIDEKNVTTDWIDDFLFNGNATTSDVDPRVAGFISLDDSSIGEMLCDCWYSDKEVCYIFPCSQDISSSEVEYFCQAAHDYFAENEFTIDVECKESDGEGDFEYCNEIKMRFYFRDDELCKQE